MTKQAIPRGEVSPLVAERIRAVRRARGVSQDELARRLSELGRFSSAYGATVHKIEACDRRVDVDDLIALATALDTTPSYLLGESDSPNGRTVLLIPVDPGITDDACHGMAIVFKQVLPDHEVVLVVGMRGNATEVIP